jgi:dihydrofolate synthase/folylpolyglutamate synthase
MSYDETIRYLYNLQKYGIKFGLENIGRLVSALNDPHKSFLSVHVAGTNGKGSTSAVIASVLQVAGLRVGLFTSPHLVSFTERIRINGKEITEREVISLAGEIRDVVSCSKDFSPTFFEVVTAMALLYFRRQGIDIAVMEAGMGGRLDATNIIMPEVSVITSIGYDHGEFLGNTLSEIAREKAGIIKKGIPVVVSHQDPEVIGTIERKAKEESAPLYLYGKDFFSDMKSLEISGIRFDYHDDHTQLHDLLLPLSGEHQMQNASVAIRAATLVLNKIGENFHFLLQPLPAGGESEGGNHSSLATHHIIRKGLKNVRWSGRLDLTNEDPPILIDGAHNPAASVVLARALQSIFLKRYGKIILILGIMGDKDIRGIMEPLLPLASEIILTAPSYSRAASLEHLADTAASLGFHHIRTAPTIKDAIALAIRDSGGVKENAEHTLQNFAPNSSLIVITGSFYTIGEAKEVLGQQGVLTRLRE